MRGLLVCACLALVASVVADVPWEMTLPNHSPIIVYEPYSDGTDPSKGWSVWTTEDGFLKEGGSDANGEIRHVTSLNRASFTLDFWGTGITLTGVTNASYEVVLDGGDAEVQTTETTLFSQDNLKLGDHILTLTLTNTSDNRMIGFVDAIIATSSPSAVKSTVYPSYDDNSDIEYTGTWEPIAIPQGVWQSTSEYRASVSLKFSNARAVAIHSPLNWGHWVYSIEVDSHIKLPANDAPFNASDFWLIRDSILYFQDNLDPSKDHTIRMTNLAQNPSNETWWWMTFTSFEVWKVEGADNNNGG
ncbi:hypothetical protein BKA62DRAFT_299222 [Auriculariales sp. MPI-PUGE-AT-0066]|nr:hypothetical protein BKA62DRAFT_299222 [Auriculariales sp. MPI-PUGE-AT-0066]